MQELGSVQKQAAPVIGVVQRSVVHTFAVRIAAVRIAAGRIAVGLDSLVLAPFEETAMER